LRPARVARGFTLIEILIVVMIMSIVMSLGVQTIASFEANQRAERAARETLVAFRFARNLAMTTGKDSCVLFNTSSNSFSIYWKSNGTTWDATPIQQPLAPGNYTINYGTERELAGTTFALNPAATVRFTYNGLGTCDSASTLALRFGSKSKTLSIVRVGDPTIN